MERPIKRNAEQYVNQDLHVFCQDQIPNIQGVVNPYDHESIVNSPPKCNALANKGNQDSAHVSPHSTQSGMEIGCSEWNSIPHHEGIANAQCQSDDTGNGNEIFWRKANSNRSPCKRERDGEKESELDNLLGDGHHDDQRNSRNDHSESTAKTSHVDYIVITQSYGLVAFRRFPRIRISQKGNSNQMEKIEQNEQDIATCCGLWNALNVFHKELNTALPHVHFVMHTLATIRRFAN